MPRVARHSREQSLDRAVALFWERGFYATSVANIEDALDMRPGSIYASFGSKSRLFAEALDQYAARMADEVLEILRQAPSPMAGLRQYFRDVARSCCTQAHRGPPPARACMIVKTLLEIGDDEPEIARCANKHLKAVESLLAATIAQAQAIGEIRPDADPRRLARLAQAQLIGLRGFAQRKITRRAVLELAEDISALFDTYAPPPGHGGS